jgi:outer membrane protein assembly factor BamB
VVWTRTLYNETFFGTLLVSATSGGVSLAGSGPAPSTPYIVDTHAFIARYDASGALIWNHRFDTPGFECACVPYDLSTDTSGIYAGGRTYDKSLPGETPFSYGGSFLRKYDFNGTVVWTTGQAGSAIGKIFADKTGMYVFGDSLARYDTSGGNRIWSVPILTQGSPSDFAVGNDEFYSGGTIFSGADTLALLVGYSQSASLVIGEVNPPTLF